MIKKIFEIISKDLDLRKEIAIYWEALKDYESNLFIQLKAIRLLHENQEASLDQIIEELNNRARNDPWLKTEDPEEIFDHLDIVYKRKDLHHKSLKDLQRYSMIVTIFSFLESQLKILSNLINLEFKFKIKASDISNNDIARYWKYLIDVYDIGNKSLSDSYSLLLGRKAIRNVIVHKGGFINKDQKKDVSEGKGLEIVEDMGENKVHIKDPKYILSFIDEIEDFFTLLIEMCDKRYVELTEQTNKD